MRGAELWFCVRAEKAGNRGQFREYSRRKIGWEPTLPGKNKRASGGGGDINHHNFFGIGGFIKRTCKVEVSTLKRTRDFNSARDSSHTKIILKRSNVQSTP